MLQFVTLIATIGNVLKIKPILRRNKDGYIVTYKNVRGRKAALNTLINLVCDNIIKPEEQIIDIAHADAYEDSLYIMDKIRERINIRDFINTSYDFCTGSHVGPNTITLFFLGKDKVEIGISRFPLFTLFHFTDNQISFEDILVAA